MKFNKVLTFLYFIFNIIIIVTSCDDTITNQNIDEIVIPSKNVSYSQHIQPLFNVKCATSGCHDDNTRAGDLSLTSYANTTASSLIVSPGLPDNSILVWAIEGNGAKLMPPIEAPVTPLNDNQIQGIRTWIAEGAKNN